MIQRLEQAGKAFEDALLVVILGGMILLAAAQIVLRNFFDIGFIWSDELLRLLVLWLAVAGAVAASRKDRHISIAVLDRFLSPGINQVIRIVLDLFTASVCGLIAWHSLKFVMGSYEYDDRLLGDIPAWILQSVMPAGFALIAWRYLLFAIRGLSGKPRAEPAS
ncbi:MAG: TRAP transporter small permease subunit [Gammaproteobacteria bacterium]|nr:TRAP transporter small permease subunit [Gammaproteobacteria bacterium]